MVDSAHPTVDSTQTTVDSTHLNQADRRITDRQPTLTEVVVKQLKQRERHRSLFGDFHLFHELIVHFLSPGIFADTHRAYALVWQKYLQLHQTIVVRLRMALGFWLLILQQRVGVRLTAVLLDHQTSLLSIFQLRLVSCITLLYSSLHSCLRPVEFYPCQSLNRASTLPDNMTLRL